MTARANIAALAIIVLAEITLCAVLLKLLLPMKLQRKILEHPESEIISDNKQLQ
jgi:hypothetical protein